MRGGAISGATYHATKTYVGAYERTFDSKTEASRAMYLWVLLQAGEIYDLELQPRFILSRSPRITYTAEFRYYAPNGCGKSIQVIEDVKGGPITREIRVKLAWMLEKGVEVVVMRYEGRRDGWTPVNWRHPRAKQGEQYHLKS